MLKKVLFVCIVAIIILGLLIGGCAKTATTTPATSTTTKTTSPSSATTTQSSAKPPSPTASTPQSGGTLRIISGAEVTSFMVGEMYSPEDMAQRVPTIETLVRYDPVKQQPVPFLAESAVEDSTAKTVTFKLRPGVNFHDGTPCDANAIKWNLDQEVAAPNTAPDFVDVSSIDVIDSTTVKVSFKKWDNSFLREMCWDSAVISPTSFQKNGLDWARINPVGTGPYKMVTFERDVKKVFQKFEGYWQKGKPYLDTIIINIIADPTVQLASLLKGENDVLGGLNPTDAVTLKDKAGFKVLQAVPTSGTFYCLAGDSANSDSPFANLKVRQAISYAIDRDAIVAAVFKGYGEVTYGANSVKCFTYNPKIAGYPFNPAKAKSLLAEAGYANGFLTTLWCRPEKVSQNTATAIQSNLADIGIKADLQVLNPGKYGQMFFGTGWSKGIFLAGMVGDPELGVVGRFFFSKDAGIGFSNSIIHPDDMEKAISDMMTSTNNQDKQTNAWQLQSLLSDTYCAVTPLLTSAVLSGISNKVHDDSIVSAWTYADTWIEK